MIPTIQTWIVENVPFALRNEAGALFDDEHCQLKYIHGAYGLGLRAEAESHQQQLRILEARCEGLQLALQDKTQIHHNVVQKSKPWWRK